MIYCLKSSSRNRLAMTRSSLGKARACVTDQGPRTRFRPPQRSYGFMRDSCDCGSVLTLLVTTFSLDELINHIFKVLM
jgi:hypothetical protein